MTEVAAKAMIEDWLAPISEANPAGEDARYDPLHETVRAEAAKLDALSGELPDWEELLKNAEKLTKTKAKDLLIESYSAYGLYQTKGLIGLAAGIFLLAESMDRFWDAMFPKVRRLKARVNSISWLVDRLETVLPETPIGADDHDALDALEAAAKRLRVVVGERFTEQAPALRPLLDNIQRLKLSLPERTTAAPGQAEPAAAPAAAAAAAPASVEPTAAPASAEAAPAPAAAPAEEKVDYEAELEKRAAEYVQPIPGDAPAGINAKYDERHESLRNDITALDSPTGGNVDWEKIVPRAGVILKEVSKDFLIGAYLGFAFWETKGLEGLAVGLEILGQLTEKYWDDAFPPARRIRGRANALSWLLDRIEEPLPNFKLTAKDKSAVAMLEVAAKRFMSTVREKFEDAAPSMRPLRDNIQRLKLSVPEPAAPKAAPAPAAAAKAAPKAKPKPAAAAVSLSAGAATLENPADVKKFTKGIASSVINASKALRAAAPADANAYMFMRLGLAFDTHTLPPAEGGKTRIPPPPDNLVKDLGTALSNQSWENLLNQAELTLQGKRFWLDLHRYAAAALAGLGKDYKAARDAVIAGTAYWVRAFPALLEMSFANGLPFASDLTKEWIESEVLPSGGGGGGGGEGAAVLGKARGLAGSGKVDDAMALLEELAHGARSARARFQARLAMAKALSSGKTTSVAVGIFESLQADVDQVALEDWEPELAAEVYSAHLACLKSQNKPNDSSPDPRIAAVYRRLCRVDPVAAMKAGI